MKSEPGFDVFLSHNTKNKPQVRQLKQVLAQRGLVVWLDEDELVPGVPWQQSLEEGIRNSKSVAVLVGDDGLGPWENEEMQAALILAVSNKQRVIPVLLPGANLKPQLPMFLGNRTWVKFDGHFNHSSVEKLVWGITDAKPSEESAPHKLDDASPEANRQPGRKIRCRLNCIESCNDVLHNRPSAFIVSLCNRFPRTEFRIYRESRPAESYNAKSLIDLIFGCFKHGETVTLEVTGQFEAMAAIFFKTAWENLEGYSDRTKEVKKRITELIDQACNRLYDQDLEEVEQRVLFATKRDLAKTPDEHRAVAIINDRLHDVSLPMIPFIARYFCCDLQISFDLPDQGIFCFDIHHRNNYELDRRILDLEIGVGTRITIVTSGQNAGNACLAIKDVLESLWQCDQWLRRRGRSADLMASVPELLEFARENAKYQDAQYGYVRNPFVSSLLTSRHIFINASRAIISKEEVLNQLAGPHAEQHGLQSSEILEHVQKAEDRQTVVPRPGFAVAHGALDRGPRISITFGVYPDGIIWNPDDDPVKLVAMVICAQDTYRTWRDYMKRFALLFRSNVRLQQQLIASENSEMFLSLLRNAEISLVKL